MVDVEQWAEVRRMKRVGGLSAREISRRTGLARDTVSRLLMAEAPPRYARARAESILDPFKGWICEQLQADPRVPSQRLRELAGEIGYSGGKTIFDAYVREVRPRFLVKRTFQRTIYRPAELVQCDLWEPSRHVLDFDEELANLAESRGLVYTRYSDDIVFSAIGTFTRRAAAALVNDASNALRNSGLEAHRRKTRIIPPGARKIVLGLTVLDDMVEHIDGCIAFASSVDKAFADLLKAEWAAVLRQNGFPST